MLGIAYQEEDFESFPKHQGKPLDGCKQGREILRFKCGNGHFGCYVADVVVEMA